MCLLSISTVVVRGEGTSPFLRHNKNSVRSDFLEYPIQYKKVGYCWGNCHESTIIHPKNQHKIALHPCCVQGRLDHQEDKELTDPEDPLGHKDHKDPKARQVPQVNQEDQ